MKRCIALLLCFSLLILSGCTIPLSDSESDSEPFTADFTIRENPEPTEIFVDENYTAPTTVRHSDSIDASELRSLLTQSVFGSQNETVSLWRNVVVYTIANNVRDETVAMVSEIAQDMSQSSAFPGLVEGTSAKANVIIRFAKDNAGITSEKDDYGNIIGGTITIPMSLSVPEQRAYLYKCVFQLAGFPEDADTSLDSILSQKPTNTPQEADWILIDFLYEKTETGMTKADCLKAFNDFLLHPDSE